MKYIIEISDRDAEKIDKVRESGDGLCITENYRDPDWAAHILGIAPYRE